MRIAVISDIHLSLDTPETGKILKRCIDHISADTVLVCGDLSEHGRQAELDAFYVAFSNVQPRFRLETVPGNEDNAHDPNGAAAFCRAYERYSAESRDVTHCHHIYQDCIVFGTSVETDDDWMPMSDVQLASLEGMIQYAAEQDIPALVFGHYILDDTIEVDWPYAFLGPQSEAIKNMFLKYGGKVIYFSGHIHRGLIMRPGGSIARFGNTTYVSVPSLCMPDNEHYTADIQEPGTGYMIEIENGKCVLYGFDFLSGKSIDGYVYDL